MALEARMTYSMPLEVYLQTGVVRGILVTNHDRLSSYLILREGDEVFSLRDATLELPDGKVVNVGSDDYIFYMHEVFLIADLSRQSVADRSGYADMYVRKDSNKALLNVGPYWIRGDVHLVPGAPLHDILLAKTRFIPVTDATLIDRPDIGPRTYLVNRSRIGCMTALGDGLVEL